MLANPSAQLSNRHGQKGCVSIILPDADMPFTADGIRPDIIVNPHSFSRMTPAHFLEALGGKAAAVAGVGMVDGTSWTDPVTAAGAFGYVLERAGYEPLGTEQLYCGKTGLPLKGRVFMGPVATMSLNHKVENKVHARGRCGPVNQNTRQPCDGRARGGGQRKGEMEEEVLVQHGAASLSDELNKLSDGHIVYICHQCNSVVSPPPIADSADSADSADRADSADSRSGGWCPRCGPDFVVPVEGTWSSYGLALPVIAGLGIRTSVVASACSAER